MKKLMIAAAIVCAAAFANAATINWALGYIEGAGAEGKGWGGEALTGATSVQLIIGTALNDGAVKGDIYNKSVAVTFGGDGYAEPAAFDLEAMASDTPYYSQIIITKGDSTLTSGIFEVQASSFGGDVAAPDWTSSNDGDLYDLTDATTGTLAGLSTFHETYVAFGAAGWQASSVPEPTSGLLLLLGVAGLALRRRRA